MRIRPFIENIDCQYLESWIEDERLHAMWCANLISYPATKEKIHSFLEESSVNWMDSAYVATEDNGTVIGFFCYNVDVSDNSGFLKLIIVDQRVRGKGYGTKMLQLALQYAFNITGVESVRLNVFKENSVAKCCYEKLGFIEESSYNDAFSYKGELWSRCRLVIHR